MHRKWHYTRWRYKRPQPKQRRHFTKSVLVTGATLILGIVLWIAGLAWGVVLVAAGFVGLIVVGFWGVRPTRGVDPDDGSQWAGLSHSLVNDWPPPP